jgi:uncharacterized protein YbjT (DUF2867 family)
MRLREVLIIGGSGFLGSHLANRLCADGINVRLPTRRRERAKHLLPLPTAQVLEADVHDPATLLELMAGQDAVINLVGTLSGGKSTGTSPYGRNFARVHVELPRKIVAAMHTVGVPRLIHVSALKAAADAPSAYLRSKAAGEAVVLGNEASTLDVSVFRPSVLFGTGDSFLTLFARLLAKAPFLPLACPSARFQPVWVQDVVTCIATSLARLDAIGRCYDLCGPNVYTLRQLVEYVALLTGRHRPVIGLSDRLSYLQAWLMEYLPGAPMSRDNYYSMQVPNVCAAGDGVCALPFGIEPMPLEAVAPDYLGKSRSGNGATYFAAGRSSNGV